MVSSPLRFSLCDTSPPPPSSPWRHSSAPLLTFLYDPHSPAPVLSLSSVFSILLQRPLAVRSFLSRHVSCSSFFPLVALANTSRPIDSTWGGQPLGFTKDLCSDVVQRQRFFIALRAVDHSSLQRSPSRRLHWQLCKFFRCFSFTVTFGFKSHTMDSQPDPHSALAVFSILLQRPLAVRTLLSRHVSCSFFFSLITLTNTSRLIGSTWVDSRLVLPRTCVPMLSNDNVFLSLYGQSIIHPFNGRLAAGYIGSCASFLCCSLFTDASDFKPLTMGSELDGFSPCAPLTHWGFLHVLPSLTGVSSRASLTGVYLRRWPSHTGPVPRLFLTGPQSGLLALNVDGSLVRFLSPSLLCSWYAYSTNNTSKLDLSVCIIVYF